MGKDSRDKVTYILDLALGLNGKSFGPIQNRAEQPYMEKVEHDFLEWRRASRLEKQSMEYRRRKSGEDGAVAVAQMSKNQPPEAVMNLRAEDRGVNGVYMRRRA